MASPLIRKVFQGHSWGFIKDLQKFQLSGRVCITVEQKQLCGAGLWPQAPGISHTVPASRCWRSMMSPLWSCLEAVCFTGWGKQCLVMKCQRRSEWHRKLCVFCTAPIHTSLSLWQAAVVFTFAKITYNDFPLLCRRKMKHWGDLIFSVNKWVKFLIWVFQSYGKTSAHIYIYLEMKKKFHLVQQLFSLKENDQKFPVSLWYWWMILFRKFVIWIRNSYWYPCF